MMHDKRRWGVGPVATAEELARKLTGSTWCLCTGFYVEGHPAYLFLNDATSEDGGQEYAVYAATAVMLSRIRGPRTGGALGILFPA